MGTKIIHQNLFSKFSLLFGFIFYFTQIGVAQDNQLEIENKDFYAVDCNSTFLDIYADTVIYYAKNNRTVICEGQKNHNAYMYYFSHNGVLMYGAQDNGETVSYLKGKYEVTPENYLLITEGEVEHIFHFWLENDNLHLVSISKKEREKWESQGQRKEQ